MEKKGNWALQRCVTQCDTFSLTVTHKGGRLGSDRAGEHHDRSKGSVHLLFAISEKIWKTMDFYT